MSMQTLVASRSDFPSSSPTLPSGDDTLAGFDRSGTYRFVPTSPNERGVGLPPVGDLQEQLFAVRASLKIWVSQVSMHLAAEWRSRLFRQIDLIHDPEDWEPADELTDAASFLTFLRLVLLLGRPGRPGLNVLPNGNLIAGWARDRDTLNIEFLPRDEMRWSVVRRFEDHVERAAGFTILRRLATVLEPYDVESHFWHADDIPAG